MIGEAWYLVAFGGAMVGIVIALFVHEAAHAVPILLAGGSAHITMGSDSGRTVEYGPLTVTVGVDSVWTLLLYGRCAAEEEQSKRVRLLSVLSGPAVTVVIVSLLGIVLYRGVDGPLSFGLTAIFYGELFRAIQTIVPKTYSYGPYSGMTSDGKRFLEVVRA